MGGPLRPDLGRERRYERCDWERDLARSRARRRKRLCLLAAAIAGWVALTAYGVQRMTPEEWRMLYFYLLFVS